MKNSSDSSSPSYNSTNLNQFNMGASNAKPRLAYIDWMRGLACILMFQTHAYDSWLSLEARRTKFWMLSKLGGTLPAPLFLFLAGISFALVTDRLRRKDVDPNQIARTTIFRGAQILGLGYLFRLQEFLFGWPYAPWSDLLRVDVLNIIGLSMILMGVLCRTTAAGRAKTVWAGIAVALIIALLTPPLYTTWRLSWLPWPVESYINGIHTFQKSPGWLFPMFPWAGFAFAGLSTGFVLLSKKVRQHEGWAFAGFGALGVVLVGAAWWLDSQPFQLYSKYHFWLTSPNFFLIRVGILLVLMFLVYVWCRWGLATTGLSPLLQLGQTSLLVYWVHIEFVYGKFILLPSRANSIEGASWGLLTVILMMLLLSIARTEWKSRGGSFKGSARHWAGLPTSS